MAKPLSADEEALTLDQAIYITGAMIEHGKKHKKVTCCCGKVLAEVLG